MGHTLFPRFGESSGAPRFFAEAESIPVHCRVLTEGVAVRARAAVLRHLTHYVDVLPTKATSHEP